MGRFLISALLVLSAAQSLLAQNKTVEDFFTVSKDEGGLVLIFGSAQKGQSLLVRDALEKKLDAIFWGFDLPLVRQFRVSKPGTYQIYLPKGDGQPLEYVSVRVLEGSLTYLQINPADPKLGAGVAVEGWTGPPPAFATDLVKELRAIDAEQALVPVSISPSDNVLYLSTDPPWPLPPKPKP